MSGGDAERGKGDNGGSSADEDRRSQERGDEGFLQRWSRRKHQAARAERQDEERALEGGGDDRQAADEREPVAADASGRASEPEQPESEPPGDEDMPPLESIDQGGSVRDFFSPKVSKSLRGAALKRLFSQPEFSAPDLLEEYAGDYSKPEPLGDMVTAEMKYRAEQALKFAERKLKEAAEREGLQQQPAMTSVPKPENSGAEFGQAQDLSGQDQTDEAAGDGAQTDEPDKAVSTSRSDSDSESPPGKRD